MFKGNHLDIAETNYCPLLFCMVSNFQKEKCDDVVPHSLHGFYYTRLGYHISYVVYPIHNII